jgi:hypothetical protein
MGMYWFIPFAIVIGILGTRTALEQHHLEGRGQHRKGWWLLLLLGWAPAVCWALSRIVPQF